MKTQLLLLHGALGSASELEPLRLQLQDTFDVRCLNLPGHSGTPFLAEPLALENLRQFLDSYIEKEFHTDAPLIVCGHSMGGYLALYSVLKGNKRIDSVITLGTKLHWSQDIAAREISLLDPNKMVAKVPHFAENLKTLHGEQNWQRLAFEVAGFLRELGEKNPLEPANVRQLNISCRIMLGDRDRMVGLEETLDFYQALPNATLCILPNTPHPFVQAETERLCFEIREVAKGLQNSSAAEA